MASSAPSAALPISTALARSTHPAVVVEEEAARRAGGDPNDPDKEDEECTTRTVTDCWVSCNAQRTKECKIYSTSLKKAAQPKSSAWLRLNFAQNVHKVTDLYITPEPQDIKPSGGLEAPHGSNGNGGQCMPSTASTPPIPTFKAECQSDLQNSVIPPTIRERRSPNVRKLQGEPAQWR
ncbi:hypothetical protein OPT61_g1081 [Boeremia exigua]|uniref:Uncharacterized protein n=1 Tax=Boeremia exigua TaxID=749465 RepID=A0ACC2IRU0_9PLEO|nr:hypothetical protein OPT61_g1081 [Boeremia exigua]